MAALAAARRCRVSARVSDHSQISGSSRRVSRVEVIRPPTTTVASGRWVSAPTPLEMQHPGSGLGWQLRPS